MLLALSVSCGGAGPLPPPPPSDEALHDDDFEHEIRDLDTWTTLASRPQNHHVARTEVVKFVIDVTVDPPITYFLQSRRFESHHDFVNARLTHDYPDGMEFYRRVYLREDRPYIVGSLVRYVDADAYTFELISGDQLSAPRILWTRDWIAERLFFGDALRFRPTSDRHSQRIAELGDRLPVANDEELYGALQYQPVQLGDAYGTLRVVAGPVERGRLGPRDLLVTDEVPDDLPLVAGLITSRFQAPLAHVAVLSGNRGTPDMALRGAFEAERVRALEGQLVHLHVGAQDYTLEPASLADAEAHWANAAQPPAFEPALDLRRHDLIDQCLLTPPDVAMAGAKATNMSTLCALRGQGVEVPEGFVVPFSHYMGHLRRHRILPRIEAFLASPERHADPTEALAALRHAIEEAPVDPALLRLVRGEIQRIAPGARVRLRSSTNAEDLPGFNGAGLYSSRALDSDASDAELARGLAHIWASVWNLGAFQEREHYRIDHTHVAMAVLIQRSIDGAIANGVAISGNPYDQVRPGVLINVQGPGASVTGAHGDELPEQWLVFTYLPAREPELIGRSTVTDGAPILRRDEVLAITDHLEAIHRAFLHREIARDVPDAIDVELLITGGDRRIVYVQARPYRLTWQGREEARE